MSPQLQELQALSDAIKQAYQSMTPQQPPAQGAPPPQGPPGPPPGPPPPPQGDPSQGGAPQGPPPGPPPQGDPSGGQPPPGGMPPEVVQELQQMLTQMAQGMHGLASAMGPMKQSIEAVTKEIVDLKQENTRLATQMAMLEHELSRPQPMPAQA